MNQSLLLCGTTNPNTYNNEKRFSDCVDVLMVEKTIEELTNKRQSLLRLNSKINNNELVVRTTYLHTEYGSIELSICYKKKDNCDDDILNEQHFASIKNYLKRIYEQKSNNVNLTNFSYKHKGSINFWWDVNNDIMWSYDTFYMRNYLLHNLINSAVSLKENDTIINNIELCKDLSCACG